MLELGQDNQSSISLPEDPFQPLAGKDLEWAPLWVCRRVSPELLLKPEGEAQFCKDVDSKFPLFFRCLLQTQPN